MLELTGNGSKARIAKSADVFPGSNTLHRRVGPGNFTPSADYLVVVVKRSNVGGAKGVGYPVGTFEWANWKQEELAGCDGGRQLSIGWHEPCDGRLSCTDL
jgi:hypothetical protein